MSQCCPLQLYSNNVSVHKQQKVNECFIFFVFVSGKPREVKKRHFHDQSVLSTTTVEHIIVLTNVPCNFNFLMTSRSYYVALYEWQRSGVVFPKRSPDAAPIFTPPPTHLALRHMQAGYGMPSNSSKRLDETMATEIETLR